MKFRIWLLLVSLLGLTFGIRQKCQIYTKDEKGQSFLGINEVITADSIAKEDNFDPNQKGSGSFFSDIDNFDSSKIDEIIRKDLGGLVNNS
jgi:hypothetical protein